MDTIVICTPGSAPAAGRYRSRPGIMERESPGI